MKRMLRVLILFSLAAVLLAAPGPSAGAQSGGEKQGEKKYEGMTVSWTVGGDKAQVTLTRKGEILGYLHFNGRHIGDAIDITRDNFRVFGDIGERQDPGSSKWSLWVDLRIIENGAQYDHKEVLVTW